MNGDGNAFQYVPGIRHPDRANECSSHSGGEVQSPPTAWPDTEGADVDDGENLNRIPGTPTLAGVSDFGLARLTVTQGSPPAREQRYVWALEGSVDGVSFFDIGTYSIGQEVTIGLIFGPFFRVRWKNFTNETYGDYSNIVHIV